MQVASLTLNAVCGAGRQQGGFCCCMRAVTGTYTTKTLLGQTVSGIDCIRSVPMQIHLRRNWEVSKTHFHVELQRQCRPRCARKTTNAEDANGSGLTLKLQAARGAS